MALKRSASRRVLIIGGGIAGPAAALFLKRVGYEPAIFEAQPEAQTDEGSFLNLASNGLHVLQQLGLAESLAAEGFRIPRMVMWNGSGKRLGEVRNGVPPGEGPVSVVVRRNTLHGLLRDAALRAGIPFTYEKRLARVAPDDGGRTVAYFADGSAAEGDLLVGCDGIHSRTRLLIDAQAAAPAYTGLLSCSGYSRSTSLQPTPDTQHLIFGKRGFFGYFVKASGEVWWFSNLSYPGEPRRAELAAGGQDEWRRRLLALHADDQPFIQELIEATAGTISVYPIYDLPTTRLWRRGPLILLGDAAHATSPSAGQGASLALEDAIVLAKCLRDHPNLDQATATYEQLRRARAEKVVAFARRQGNGKAAPNQFARRMRDLFLPVALRLLDNSRQLDWLYGYRVAL
jgi:FAD-dependent urate hydroxylase